ACADELAKQLASEAAYLTPSDRDDFSQAILLEILTCLDAGATLDEPALRRLFHRVRQRILRQSGREKEHDALLIETVSAVHHAPSAEFDILDSLSPEDLILIDMVTSGSDEKAIATELKLSIGTVYRRLRSIRARLM
ncbi:MAG TPA: hypothetical protein PK867_23790, partial [Pirellulales bacterium]|nr:hypothetical protein [Pirellulales bacterium]